MHGHNFSGDHGHNRGHGHEREHSHGSKYGHGGYQYVVVYLSNNDETFSVEKVIVLTVSMKIIMANFIS